MVSWVPCFIIFLIVLGEFARRGDFVNIPMGSGEGEAGSVLSFAASVFGFATGWTSYASDYTCYQPVNTSRTKVFFYVFIGLLFPLCFTEMLGVAIATAITNNQAYADAYASDAVGGLLHEVLVPPLGGFGKFCVVILALSIVGNNCPNIYSLTFSLQILTHYAQMIPRFLWDVDRHGDLLRHCNSRILCEFLPLFPTPLYFVLTRCVRSTSNPSSKTSCSSSVTGSLSTKASLYPNTSSSRRECAATPPNTMTSRNSCLPESPPRLHLGLVSWGRRWAWRRCGILDRLES